MINDIVIVPKNINRATVVKETGVVYVDYLFWSSISQTARVFSILHEKGHLVLNSNDEDLSDKYAKQEMLKMGYSVKQITSAVNEVLGKNRDPKSKARMQLIKGTKHNLAPFVIPAIGNIITDALGLINRGKRDKAAYQAALERQQENNATAIELAIIEARERENRAGLIIAIVALLAGTAIAIALLRSPKYPNIVLPTMKPKGRKLLPGTKKLIN
jgi:hypothetical protein